VALGYRPVDRHPPPDRTGMTDPTVLFVSTKIPYPLTEGSAIRQLHVLRGYAKVASVKLITFVWDTEDLKGAELIRAQGIDLVALPLTAATGFGTQPASLWRRRVRQALRLRPLMAAAFRSAAMSQAVQQAAASASLVHAYRLWTVPNLESVLWGRDRRQPFVLDLDDVETVTRARMLAAAPAVTSRRRMFDQVDLLRLRRYQARVLARSDCFFVCSRRDQARFTGGKAVIIPNGATLPPSPLPEEGDGRTILAVGLLSFEPNVSALRFFVREIFPVIRSALPDARLLIVGRDPTPEVLALHDGRTIEVAANVPSMEPYYRRAAISVVPLLAGGGTRLRILESFAMGRAVVATPIGCEGLDVINGEHLLVAHEAPLFAEACVGLLQEPQRRHAIAGRARALVEQEYTWDSIEKRVALVAERLLSRGTL
jgi:glycosyltransferase involved in cell wall biosynthesis